MAINKKKRTALDEILPPPKNGTRAGQMPSETGANHSQTAAPSPNLPEQRITGVIDNRDKNAKKEIVKVMLYLPLPVAEQMRGLHFEEQRGNLKRSKLHDYYLEAIDLLFKQRGLKSIAEISQD